MGGALPRPRRASHAFIVARAVGATRALGSRPAGRRGAVVLAVGAWFWFSFRPRRARELLRGIGRPHDRAVADEALLGVDGGAEGGGGAVAMPELLLLLPVSGEGALATGELAATLAAATGLVGTAGIRRPGSAGSRATADVAKRCPA